MSRLVPVAVPFMGVTLQGALKDGIPFVALRPIVEGIGLDWASQYTKVTTNEVIGPTVVEITMVAEDGRRRAMTCIPEEYLQGWMFGIKANKVLPAIKPKVLRYQRECYRVLHEAFNAAQASTAPLRMEYLHGHHTMHDVIRMKAAQSSNERFVHMNVEKRINKSARIGPGQRQTLDAPKLGTIVVAHQIAAVAFAAGEDHHDGYDRFKSAMDQLDTLLVAGPTARAALKSTDPPRKRQATKGEARAGESAQASMKDPHPAKGKGHSHVEG